MGNITLKMLATELHLSTAAVSKALRDSHEISSETKQRVSALADKLNYVSNPYAGSLRKRKSKTIAVVLPEVADSFFSLALNGIESVAIEKGYHVLIYLTHEKITREKAILKDFQSGRVDGVLMSITDETNSCEHIRKLLDQKIPLVFFDRVGEEITTTKIITDDYESGYKATQHLIDCGCKNIVLLSISASLSISVNRTNGYKQALTDNKFQKSFSNIIFDTKQPEENYNLIKKILSKKNKPDGIIATVEKLTPHIYLACQKLKLKIPHDVKVVCFSNLSSAAILNPSLTTITQPAFEIGKTAAAVLFKALEKNNFNLEDEHIIIPSVLKVRDSTSK
jgi:LacI family transcriptional regulator